MSTFWNRVSICTLCTEIVGDVSMWVPSSERNFIRDRKGSIHHMMHCDETETSFRTQFTY